MGIGDGERGAGREKKYKVKWRTLLKGAEATYNRIAGLRKMTFRLHEKRISNVGCVPRILKQPLQKRSPLNCDDGGEEKAIGSAILWKLRSKPGWDI